MVVMFIWFVFKLLAYDSGIVLDYRKMFSVNGSFRAGKDFTTYKLNLGKSPALTCDRPDEGRRNRFNSPAG